MQGPCSLEAQGLVFFGGVEMIAADPPGAQKRR